MKEDDRIRDATGSGAKDHESMSLSGHDRDALLAVLRSPSQPAERLIRAFRRYVREVRSVLDQSERE